ncbi:MAG: CvpA family protein [Daejeonella sp.]|uniref:CvpA family protein n=1 Tax=Daejeonella sp. TaxID=2805397 RepID=UPI002735CEAD|nr:CvpA family protein [Daejeonella sp.]MDP3470132.1 CvpA family protein [Daejeonella sp.]
MNYIDLILISIILLAVWRGWAKGFLVSATEIFIWLGSLIVALLFSEFLATALEELFDISIHLLRPLSFVLILTISSRMIFATCDRIIGNIPESKNENRFNKLGGIIPGLFSGVLYALLLSIFFLLYPVGDATKEAQKSIIANTLSQKPSWAGERVNNTLNDLKNKFGRSLTIFPNGKEIIPLPFKVLEPRLRRELELRMLDMINKEREKLGLPVLYFDEELAAVARKHSKDMFRRGYFSHYNPEGNSPFDRIRREGIQFRIAGENLALAQNLSLAHYGLMESTTHRANIEHKAFGRVGIGILDGGYNGLMITQLFRN